jgi:colanic acid biosynthesis glycosyl transferase WcaI
MKILLLSQWFDPEPAFKGIDFARELHRRGHSVEVLTGFPNYPDGCLYPGYRVRAIQREVVDGVRVIRVPLYPSHDKSAVRRVLNYGSFALSAATIGALSISQPDVVYVYHPPTTIALASTVLRLFRNVPIVADIQDLWPDTVLETGMLLNPLAIALLKLGCRFAFRQMDKIAVLSPGIKRELVNRGLSPEKIHVIYNWCNERSMEMRPREEGLGRQLGFEGRFNILFAGNLGPQQGLGSVLEAAKLSERELPDVQFVFVGGGIERESLASKAVEMGLSNVRFLPQQPREAMGPILALADVLLVHLRDLPLFKITIPSKTQAYMAAGKPILMAVRGDAADLVRESNAGLCCPPEDPRGLVDSIAAFRRMPATELVFLGMNGAKFYQERLSMQAGVDQFEIVLNRAITARRGTFGSRRSPIQNADNDLPGARP